MNNKHPFGVVCCLTVFLFYLYFFSEWLFFATKPSFVTELNWQDSLAILFIAPLPVIMLALPIVALVTLIARITPFGLLQPVIPALILASFYFMLIDNFTHTVLGFYAGSFQDWRHFAYAILLIALFIIALKQLNHWQIYIIERWSKWWYCALIPLGISIGWAAFSFEPFAASNQLTPPLPGRTNILILSTDGLEASNMSVYGYERTTTPFIESLVGQSLVAENSFTNAANTTGSLGALFSGTLPTRTGVVFRPSIFKGKDRYQHFIGLMRSLGYCSVEIGIPYIAEAKDLDLQNAFESPEACISGALRSDQVFLNKLRFTYGNENYFLIRVSSRLYDRYLHIFGIRPMVDSFQLVTREESDQITDEMRRDQLFEIITDFKESKSPFFIHIHFMGTHGPKFNPNQNRFSLGKSQDGLWMTDFYDDVISDYDDRVKDVFKYLEGNGLLEETVVVLTTDHGRAWKTYERLPLIIRFPNGQHQGVITENTQRADVPPTIIDYLGFEVPVWMDGRSLLGNDLLSGRHLFAAANARNQLKGGQWAVADFGPPYYSMGAVSLIECSQWRELDLKSGNLKKRTINNRVAPCIEPSQLTDGEVTELIVSHLQEMSYSTTRLERKIRERSNGLIQLDQSINRLLREGLAGADQRAYYDAEFAVFRLTDRNVEDVIPLNQMVLLKTDKGLKFESTGNDPYFLLPEFDLVQGQEHMVRLVISVSVGTTLQMFFNPSEEDHFVESNSSSVKIESGINEIFLRIPGATSRGLVRIDPGATIGEYHLTELEVRVVRHQPEQPEK